jgi:hypothetical protein
MYWPKEMGSKTLQAEVGFQSSDILEVSYEDGRSPNQCIKYLIV